MELTTEQTLAEIPSSAQEPPNITLERENVMPRAEVKEESSAYSDSFGKSYSSPSPDISKITESVKPLEQFEILLGRAITNPVS